jgi:hypothetical protein
MLISMAPHPRQLGKGLPVAHEAVSKLRSGVSNLWYAAGRADGDRPAPRPEGQVAAERLRSTETRNSHDLFILLIWTRTS